MTMARNMSRAKSAARPVIVRQVEEFLAMLADKKEMARRRAGAARAMKRIDKIREEIAKKYPNQPDSVDLIREDRDSR